MLAFKIQCGTSPEFDRNEGFEFEGSRHMKKLNKHGFTVVSFIILLAIGCPTVVASSAVTSDRRSRQLRASHPRHHQAAIRKLIKGTATSPAKCVVLATMEHLG